MRILFFSLLEINEISTRGLYTDLLREYVKNGHDVTVISPVERRSGRRSERIDRDSLHILRIRTGNIQKTNYLEKGLSLVLLGRQIDRGLRKLSGRGDYDCILFATPPVTIHATIKKLKKTTGACTVLMLKDIWPQEIVDLGLISDGGLLFRFFKRAEKRIYAVADWIGYTSPASRHYLEAEGLEKGRLIPIHNSVDPHYSYQEKSGASVREKLGIGDHEVLFFYGGNLGKPQDIEHVISCLETQRDRKGVRFVLCGQGTERGKLEKYFAETKPGNMTLLAYLPKEEYDQLIMEADVGMVFLNHRFTVPNCPTRFYDYMQFAKPVLACTDTASDIRDDIAEGHFGWWCESRDPADFQALVEQILSEGKEKLQERGARAREHLERYYTVNQDYRVITDAVNRGVG